LGRVTKSKGIEDAIRAVSIVSRSHRVNIWIIGKEDYQYLHELLSLTKTLKLEKQVKVCGYVSEREKFELLSRAWILIHPSKTEGWGINVIEGNAMGIPAIGYKVPGLADSIQAGKTGLLTSTMTPEGLAMEIKKLLKNKQLYNKMSLSAVEWAKNFSWEKTGEKTLEILQNL
jgi:glycosyltransferase involved in cell wall biosynthesis